MLLVRVLFNLLLSILVKILVKKLYGSRIGMSDYCVPITREKFDFFHGTMA